MSEMNVNEAEKRIDKLKDLINEYRYEYHVHNNSIMSEAAADSLKHELSQLEEQFPELITSDSPTQRVAGEPLPEFKSVRHQSRMLSMNDVFNFEELEAWETRIKKYYLANDGSKASSLEAVSLRQGSVEGAVSKYGELSTGPDKAKMPKSPAESGALQHSRLGDEVAFEYYVDFKMDGFSCSLIYQDGFLERAVTRGDGFVGEDVTQNVKTLSSIPLRLRKHKDYEGFLKGRTEVRGEILMYKKDFEILNEKRAEAGEPLFKNPRNTAAGTMRQLDSKLVAERKMHFHGFDLISDSNDVLSYSHIYKTMKAIGIKANKEARSFKSLKELKNFVDKWQENRKKLPFGIDGLAIKINNKKTYEQLGVVGKAPRGAVAYKYPAEQTTTKVKDIFISVGRTGAATPVAILDPVNIAGSTVQMATLHNEGEVARKDVRVGDTVIIQKAGDIIPEVVKPLEELRSGNEKPYRMSKTCPDCKTSLVRERLKSAKRTGSRKVQGEDEKRSESYGAYDNRASGTSTKQFLESTSGVINSADEQADAISDAWEAVWRCPNDKCPSRVANLIQHFASKSALDIESLGDKNVVALLNNGLIETPADLYELKKEQLLELDRFAEKSAHNLIEAIVEKKNPPLHKFLFGLGIRHVGTQTAVDLSQEFKNLDNIGTATYEELKSVEGVGEIVADSIIAWFSDQNNIDLLAKFRQLGVWPKSVKKMNSDSNIANKKFVVTGSLDGIGRQEAAEMIRNAGGVFQSSVGKDTDFLVVGTNVGASKLNKADKLGVKQINQKEFLELIKG